MAFPQTPLDVDVELYYDAAWNNINAYVYHRSGSPIIITRGRANEGKRCDPAKLVCEINNRDGRFSPRNPNSVLYGKIGRNTPIRVSVTHNAVTYTRFVGELTSWPSRWEVSGRDIWVPVEAYGILKRLGQGARPLRAPLQPSIEADSPYRYWPMEDGPDSAQFASGLSGGAKVIPTAGVEFAAIAGAAGAGDFGPSFLNGTLTIPLDLPGPFSIEYIVAPASDDDGQVLFGFSYMITGSAVPVNIGITSPTYVDPTLEGSLGWHHVLISMQQAGSDIDLRAWFDGAEVATADHFGAVLGNLIRLEMGITGGADPPTQPWGIAHVAVYASASAVDAAARWQAVRAYAGETTTERLDRICTLAGIPFAAPVPGGAQLGPQRQVAVLQALRDAEDVDQGFLFEQREALGLKYRTNASRYNQAPVTLDYDAGHVSPPLDPEPDDQNVANDRQVKRRNGSSARRELTFGPLSVLDPPDGVGRYDDSITLDAYSDDQLEHIANWRLHIGTWDAERYPRVRVDLSANPDLIPTVAGLDSGDHVRITGLPSWLPPEDAELIVEGYRETLGFHDWDIVVNCSPAGPYNAVSVWALLSHELHAAVNSSATSIEIANTDLQQPMLATAGLGSGYGLSIGGEQMQLSAVANSTITFGAAGTAAHANNANVTPGIPAGVATGNLLLCLAAIRNSGTGVPNTPAGYTRLPVFPAANVQVFAKIAVSGAEAAPTITFAGGVANADTSAQMCRLTGIWHDIARIIAPGGAAWRLNPSAQIITYPGLPQPVWGAASDSYDADALAEMLKNIRHSLSLP